MHDMAQFASPHTGNQALDFGAVFWLIKIIPYIDFHRQTYTVPH